MVVLVSSTSTNGAVIRKSVMLAAPILIDRSMTYYCAGVSGKGNRINPIWPPNKREMDMYHHGPGPIPIICQLPGPPSFLIGHYNQTAIF
jgi:hypothetical protein